MIFLIFPKLSRVISLQTLLIFGLARSLLLFEQHSGMYRKARIFDLALRWTITYQTIWKQTRNGSIKFSKIFSPTHLSLQRRVRLSCTFTRRTTIGNKAIQT